MTDRTALLALADDLEMYASQVRESASGEGSPPAVYRLDDWLVRYRDALKENGHD